MRPESSGGRSRGAVWWLTWRRRSVTRVVSYARHFIGIPYSYGGSSPGTGFDCSGLVRFVYGHFGIRLPHSSWADLSHGRRISRRSLRPGDLVFFYGAGHVGIYVGRGRFIDAPHSGARVRVSTMGAYSGYYGARRFRAELEPQRIFSAMAVSSFQAIVELVSTSGRKSHGVMP